MDTLKFGFKYFKKYLIGAILIELVSFVAIIFEMLTPLLSAMLIDFIIKGQDAVIEKDSGGIFHFLLSGRYGEPGSFELFYWIAGWFLAFILLRIILVYIRNLYQQDYGLKLETDLRADTYHKLNELDSETLASYNSGELLQIINNDTIMFKELFCRIIPNNIDAFFSLSVMIVILGLQNPWFVLIPSVLAPVFGLLMIRFRKKAIVNFRNIRKCQSEMNLAVTENVSAVRLVRSFTNEDLEMEKFDRANLNQKDANIDQIKLSANYDIPFSLIRQSAYIGTLAIGAVLVMQGKLGVGGIAACASYVMKIMVQVQGLSRRYVMMQQQLVSGQKMKHFMECETRIPDKKESTLTSKKPYIRLKNVSLDLDDQNVLNGIDLDIPYGKKVGIVGTTGSGKSVLLKTLVRVYDVSGGSITIDGHDIKDFSLHNLRNMFSYVFQNVFLFSNTINANIAYSDPEATEPRIRKAAKNAQASKFIDGLVDNYDTIIGERGLGLSGGQKQRLSIARAFLKNAPVLVLDDSTSALDVNTERALLDELKKNYKDRTVIITAHRLSSVVHCDEILYMQDGHIAERGTFDELMKKNGVFAEVYRLQQAQAETTVNYDTLRKGGED